MLSHALADGSGSQVRGVLDSAPNQAYRLEFFSASTAGNAAVLVGVLTVTTDASGHASFTAALAPVALGHWVTATATRTDAGFTVFGSTSETGTAIQAIAPTAPLGTSGSVNLVEDTARPFSVADFGFSDLNGDALAGVRFDALPISGTVTLAGVAVSAGQTVAVADIIAGLLGYAPAADANDGNTVAADRRLQFSVQDETGRYALAPSTLTLAITAVNDAPVITSNGGGASAAINVPETTTAVTTVTATDIDSAALTYSIAGGADAARFQINAATGVLSFIAAPDFENPTDANGDNVYEIIVRASDGSLHDDQTLAVTVTDVSSVLVVTTTADNNDSGIGNGATYTAEWLNAHKGPDAAISLREAIMAANNSTGPTTIHFAITGTSAHTIVLAAALPAISRPVLIDARTDDSYNAGTGQLAIVLDGNNLDANGLTLMTGAGGSEIRGLVIQNFLKDGISVGTGANGVTIAGNYIGRLNAVGVALAAASANDGNGISVLANNVVIGGVNASDRNVISGNGVIQVAVQGTATGTRIIGNYIGLNAAGTSSVTGASSSTNHSGIVITGGASATVVGGTLVAERNVISGNDWNGITITNGSANNSVLGNYIGTDRSGSVAVGNANGGVSLLNAGAGNVIGGGAPGAGNLIAGNSGTGLYISGSSVRVTVQGNQFGLAADNSTVLPNTNGPGVNVNNASNVLIGTDGDGSNDAAEGNVFTDPGRIGVTLSGATTSGNIVAGNWFGTNRAGIANLGIQTGVFLHSGAHDNVVGGPLASQSNLFRGATSNAIALRDDGGRGNAFLGNRIFGTAGREIDLNTNLPPTVNDPLDVDTGPNDVQNKPTIGFATANGASSLVRGSLDSAANSRYRIEIFAGSSSGNLSRLVGFANVTTDASGNASFTVNVGALAVGEWLRATATQADATFSSFSSSSEVGPGVQALAPTPPTGANATRVTSEDTARAFELNDFGYSDVNGDGFAGVRIDTLPVSGGITLNGGAVAVGQTIAAADIVAGHLVYTPAPNANDGTIAAGDRSFSFSVADETGSYAISANTLTLSITAVNDAPVITSNGGGASAAINVPETTTAVTTVTATDIDSAALTYSIAGGADAARFQIDAATGALSFIAAPDFEAPTDADGNNVYEVTVQVSDGALVATQALAVTVTDVSNVLVVTTEADNNDSGVASGAPYTAEWLNAHRGPDGQISLREAITAANNSPGTTLIRFAIAGTGTHTITLTEALPTISRPVLINASTDDSFAANGNRPAIVLDGNGGSFDGLRFAAGASDSEVRGLVIRHFDGNGIIVAAGADRVRIAGNHIGALDPDDGGPAPLALGNYGRGLVIHGAQALIGGPDSEDRNVIAGNGLDQILIAAEGDGAVIIGNFVGTDASGTIDVNGDGPALFEHSGIVVSGANGVVIGGLAAGEGNLISGNDYHGIEVGPGSSQVLIQGNVIGTDLSGTLALGNGSGICVWEADEGVVIGGSAAGASNVISGNHNVGILLGRLTQGATVQGNLIGLAADGQTELANRNGGIEVTQSAQVQIGTDGNGVNDAAEGNVIVAPGAAAVAIASSSDTVVAGNRLGTNAGGTVALGLGVGVSLNPGTVGVRVGGVAANAGNLIVGATGVGIHVADGSTGNALLGNRIVSSAAQAIDLGGDGITANDPLDADTGANDRQNFPVVAHVLADPVSGRLRGEFNGAPGTSLRLEFFASSSAGEAARLLGHVDVTTDPAGRASFDVSVGPLATGEWVSATATVATAGFTSFGSTSELSAAVQAIGPAAPTGSDATVTLDEDTARPFTLADFGFADANGDAFAALRLNSLPGSGTLTLAGVAVSAGQTVTAADIAAGLLVYSLAPDANNATLALANRQFTFSVRDDTGSDALAPNTLTLSITPINDAPLITSNGGGASAAINVPETTTAVTTVTATDIDSAALTYSIAGGADAARFQIDAATGALSFIAAPDFEAPTDADGNNVYLVTVQVSDGALVATQALAVTVTDVSNVLVVTTEADNNDSGVASGAPYTAEWLNAHRGPDGQISLREAITAANNSPGTTLIRFAIAGTGVHTIQLTSALPDLIRPVRLDASSDDSFAANGSRPAVLLDGGGGAFPALVVAAGAAGSEIRGFVIQAFASDAVVIHAGADGTVIAGNHIGRLDAAGQAAAADRANAGNGILVGAADVVIGGMTPADRNVIAGNGTNQIRVLVTGHRVRVIGNHLGTDLAGLVDVDGAVQTGHNHSGIVVSGADGARIGGTDPAERNLISGNGYYGVELVDGASNARVQGNLIGTDITGQVALGNGHGLGLWNSGAGNLIGGGAPGAGNVIAGNLGLGLYVGNQSVAGRIQGNLIGLSADGTSLLGNAWGGLELSDAGGMLVGTDGDGTADAAEANWVAASGGTVVRVAGSTATGNVIAGNWIGTDRTGTAALGGGTGIRLLEGAHDNRIGGLLPVEANRIVGMTTTGIGLAPDAGLANALLGNLITGAPIAIDLGEDGPTINDTGDGDSGPNALQNHPVLTEAVVGDLISGYLSSTAGAPFRIEVFGSATPGGLAYRIGQVDVTTNSVGQATFQLAAGLLQSGHYVSATATLGQVLGGLPQFESTSEASPALAAIDGRPPTGSDATLALDEDESLTLGPADFGFADLDGHGFDAVRIDTLPVSGSLTLAGVTVGPGQWISMTDLGAGHLVYTPAANANDTTLAINDRQWRFTVRDASGETAVTPSVLTFSIAPVNDAPVITTSAGSSDHLEGGPATVVDGGLTVVDVDSPTLSRAEIRIDNVVAGQDRLELGATTPLTVTWDAATGTLTLTGTASVADYEAWLRTVTYRNTSTAPVTSDRTISFRVHDGDLDSAAATRTLTLTPVDDAPVISSNGGTATAAISVAENTTAVTTVIAVDPDGLPISYAIAGGADAARFQLDPVTGQLAFLVAPDFEAPVDADGNNVYEVIVAANDGSLTTTQTLQITVTDVSNILVVTTADDTDDSGIGVGAGFDVEWLNAHQGPDAAISLREAILAANNSTGPTTIRFAIPGSGVHTLSLSSALPDIHRPVILDASSDDSFAANGHQPAVVLDGNGGAYSGLVLASGAQDSVIRGLVIRHFGQDGIHVQAGADRSIIAGNYLGALAADGSSAGAGLGNGGHGIRIDAARVVIGGTAPGDLNVIAGNDQDQIRVAATASATRIVGNRIGTDASGMIDLDGPPQFIVGHSGILVDGADGVIIGGLTAAERNLISGNNYFGVELATGTTNARVQGNYIGTDLTGNQALGNLHGVGLWSAGGGNLIGGSAPGAGNLIAGNASVGLFVAVTQQPSVIQGNRIGLNADGTASLGTESVGIQVLASSQVLIGSDGNGSDDAAEGNLITVTGGAAISIGHANRVTVAGNRIGSNATGTVGLGTGTGVLIDESAHDNRIGGLTASEANRFVGLTGPAIGLVADAGSRNSLLGNLIVGGPGGSGVAIDLGLDGPTGNDPLDGDSGPNDFQNHPVLTHVLADGSASRVRGVFDSTPGRPFRLEFFSSPIAGEAATLLGFVNVTTDASGQAAFSVDLGPITAGHWLIATATEADATFSSFGSTSEASAAVEALPPLEPTGADATLALLEDTARPFTVADFGFADANGDALAAVRVDTLPGSGALTLAGVAVAAGQTVAVADIAAGLLVYTPAADANDANTTLASRQWQFTVQDDTGRYATTPATLTLAITPVNDAPVVTTTTGDAAFTEDGPAVAIDPTLTLVDIDSPTLAGATVRITGHHAPAEDLLAVTVPAGVTADWDAASGTLTLTGSASLADYQAALRSVTYANTSVTPSLLPRTISFTVNDGDLDSAAATRSVTVADVRIAPVADAATASGAEDASAIAIDLSGSDADGQITRFRVTALPAHGSLYADAGLTTAVTVNALLAAPAPGAAATLTLYFVPAADWHGTTSFQYTVLDNEDGESGAATAAISVAPVNDAPVLTPIGPELPVLTEDQAAEASPTHAGQTVASFIGGSIGDIDGGPTPGIAIIAATAVDGRWQYSTDAGASWQDLAPVADDSALLLLATDRVRFVSWTQVDSTSSLSYRGWDRSSGQAGDYADASTHGGIAAFSAATDTVIQRVTAVNDAPVVTTTAGPAAYVENDAPVAIDPGLAISDVDSATLAGAVVRITAGFAAGEDVLAFVDQAGISGHWDAATGTLTLTGTAALADYQAALRSVTFHNTSDAPSTLVRTIGVTVDDGDLASAEALRTITVTAVNDAPVLLPLGPALTPITEDDLDPAGQTVASFLGTSISDPDDAALAGIAITGATGGRGTWQYSTDNGLTWAGLGPVSDSAALLLSGSDRLRLVPDGIDATTATLTYRAWDQTTGTAGSVADASNAGGTSAFSLATDTATLAVTAVNDAPVVTTTAGSVAYVENAAPVAIDPGLAISDVDSATLAGAVVRITAGFAAGEDVLAIVDQAGISGHWDAVTGTLTLSGTASLAEYQAALRSVTYQNTSNAPSTLARTLRFSVDDGDLTSADALRTITVTAVNDAPVVTTTAGPVAYVENDVAVVIDPGLAISDVDSPTLAGAVVRITAGFAAGEDVLAFVDQAGISGHWDAATGTLTLSGTASLADYQAALRSVTFHNTSDAPSSLARTIRFTVDDGDLASAEALRTITVTPVNDAPVLLPHGPALTPITEDDLDPVGQTVASLIGASISDPDPADGRGIAITATASSHGNWQFSLDGGLTWSAIGPVSDQAARLLGDSDRVRFVPDGIAGTTASFSFRAWDRTQGSAGDLADASLTGGTTPFSLASDSATLVVTDLNDRPTTDDSQASGLEDATAIAVDLSGRDIDGTVVAFRLVGLPGDGLLYRDAALTQALAAGDSVAATGNAATVYFVPAANWHGTTRFGFHAIDDSGDGAGGDPATATVTVIPVNDAPVLVPGEIRLTPIDSRSPDLAGQSVAALIAGRYGDVDVDVDGGGGGGGGGGSSGDGHGGAGGAVDRGSEPGIAIIGAATTSGHWEYSTDGGATWQALGAVDEATALLLGATDRVRLVPIHATPATASLVIIGWDQTTGGVGQRVDARLAGGSTAFSVERATVAQDVTWTNAVPQWVSHEGQSTVVLAIDRATPIVTTVAATDPDQPTQQLVYRLIGGADAPLFQVDPQTGVVRWLVLPAIAQRLDANADGSYEFGVGASDGVAEVVQWFSLRVGVDSEVPTGPVDPIPPPRPPSPLPPPPPAAPGPTAQAPSLPAPTTSNEALTPAPAGQAPDRVDPGTGESRSGTDEGGDGTDPLGLAAGIPALIATSPPSTSIADPGHGEPLRLSPSARLWLRETALLAGPDADWTVRLEAWSLQRLGAAESGSERLGSGSATPGSEPPPQAVSLDDNETSLVVDVRLAASAVLGFTVALWLARSGALLTSLLLSTPAWRSYDLLPVVRSAHGGNEDEDEDEDHGEDVDESDDAAADRAEADAAATDDAPTDAAPTDGATMDGATMDDSTMDNGAPDSTKGGTRPGRSLAGIDHQDQR